MTTDNLNKDFQLFSTTWKNEDDYNEKLFGYFFQQVINTNYLREHAQVVIQNEMGFGDPPFKYMWLLLINQLPKEFKFLEIGVYKGSVISLIKLISDKLDKKTKIFGITPLNASGDKFYKYLEDDYLKEIGRLHSLLNISLEDTTILKGYSTEPEIQDSIREEGMFDIVFIDGCHDYEVVINDLELCDSILRPNGFLVMDDASCDINLGKNPPFKGWPDVSKAIHERMDNNPNYTHLFACGHNRVWRKNDKICNKSI